MLEKSSVVQNLEALVSDCSAMQARKEKKALKKRDMAGPFLLAIDAFPDVDTFVQSGGYQLSWVLDTEKASG